MDRLPTLPPPASTARRLWALAGGTALVLTALPSLADDAALDEGRLDEAREVSYAESGWAELQAEHAPAADGLLVDLADALSDDEVAELEESLGIRLDRDWDVETGNRYVVRGDEAALVRTRKLLEGRADVESVEANVFYSLVRDPLPAPPYGDGTADDEMRPTKPNDPLYKSQWHFAMVNAEGAWARTAGQGVIVAVIDTGVSPGKLKDGKKSKFKRVPDLNDTELVPGYDFVANKADPSDGNGHGTHVAGTIAQSTHNAFGVAGLAYKAKIMPVKVLSDRGWGTVGAIASGIRWAADNGAQVINMSLGGGGHSASMAKAVKYAHDKGVTVVCAAGNGGREKVEYPAAYPGAFAVSALGPDNQLAFYSSYGKELAIAAPGGDTRVDLNGDGIPDGVLQDTIARGDPSQHGFFPFQGTSMATPHVAAAAALVVSTGVTDPDRVEKILRASATDLKDPVRYGAGGLDAAAAVKKAQHDKSFLSLALAMGLGLVLVRRTRKKDSLSSFKPGLGFAGAMVMGASGLFFLHDLGLSQLPVLGILAAPVASWPAAMFGQGFHLNPIIGSFALALVPMVFLFGMKNLRGVLAGFAVGVAGFLLARAVLGEVNVQWVPGHGLYDAAWLFVNGALATGLGALAMKRD